MAHDELQTVPWKWVKKSVSQRQHELFFSKSPGYHHLGEDYDKAVIAFRYPLLASRQMPSYLLICSEVESAKLNEMTQKY